jgi:ribosome maturation factor RimP
MNVSYEKIPGIDRERLHAAVGPVLAAHSVECVECIWRTDRGGWLLEISIERAESSIPGYGVTVDLCADISRDLSAALDVADCIPHRYTLEVGSPGVERALYVRRDYERFAGQAARLKLSAPRAGQSVIFGTLHGLDQANDGAVLIETEQGELASIELETIQGARLLFQWKKGTGTRAMAKGLARRGQNSLPAGMNSAGSLPQGLGARPQNERRTSGKAKKSPPPQRSR